jgi:hypothetical protein
MRPGPTRRWGTTDRRAQGTTGAEAAEDPNLWLSLVDHILERLRAGRAPESKEVIPLPVPAPSRDATAPTPAGAPPSKPGPQPPLPPLPGEPPTQAMPPGPDAGARGGGILL